MVAGESDSRIQTALVAKWPEPIDVKDGIFVPGKVEKWSRELTAALRTRGLLESLRTRAPSIEELCDQFPNEDVDVVVELYDDITIERKRHLETVADNLPSVVLYSSMTMSDQLRFNALASEGAGDQLYAMVMELCDISCGRAQDRLQTKYVEVALQPSDSVARVISQIELKWWLFKHNRMYCHNNSDTRNDLEGVRQMLLMLSKGPQAFSVQATLELPQLSAVTCPDANAWMKARTDHLLRYGEQLMTTMPGALHAALPGAGEGDKLSDKTVQNFDTRANLDKEAACYAMADVSQVADETFWKNAGFSHDVNEYNSCCWVKGCKGPVCIIKSSESVGGPTSKFGESKWSKLRVGWLIQELRDFHKKNPTFDFKIPSKDYRLPPINYSGKNPARSMSTPGGKGKGGNQSRGGGGRGRGRGGFGGWMLPEAPEDADGVDGVDGLLAVVADHSIDDGEDATELMVGRAKAPATPAAFLGALCMMYPGPVPQAGSDLSSSGSSVSSSASQAVVASPLPAQQFSPDRVSRVRQRHVSEAGASVSPVHSELRSRVGARMAELTSSGLRSVDGADHDTGAGTGIPLEPTKRAVVEPVVQNAPAKSSTRHARRELVYPSRAAAVGGFCRQFACFMLVIAVSLIVGACCALGGPMNAGCAVSRYSMGNGSATVNRVLHAVCDGAHVASSWQTSVADAEVESLRAEVAALEAARQTADEERRQVESMLQVANDLSKASRLAAQRAEEDAQDGEGNRRERA